MRGESPIFPIIDALVYIGGDPPYSVRGGWQPCRCPLHGDRNASASVSVTAQRFNCHVCMERSEDAIGLVMLHESCDYKRAVEILESITTAENDPGAKRPKGMSELFE